jgi:outer membrane protein OmpU
MKKLLIGTTALVSILSGAALADTVTSATGPSVKVGGFVNFQFGSLHHKGVHPNVTPNQKNNMFNNTSRIAVSADGMADAGFKYGANVNLVTSAQSRTGFDSANTDLTYIYVESNAGRIELGSNYSAAKAMRTDAGSFARGTGGASAGDWTNYATGFTTGNWMTNANLVSDNQFTGAFDGTNAERSRKITYYTARYSGFQVGVSYALDSSNTGDSFNKTGFGLGSSTTPRSIKDHWTAGITYSNQYDQVTVNGSLVGEMGKGQLMATDMHKHNLKGWDAGASVSYAGFTVGGSYGSSSKKFAHVEHVTLNDRDVKYWTAGAAYVQGPVGVSVNYLHSTFQHNKLAAWGVSADYALAPGMLPYVEATWYKGTPAATPAVKNKGQVYIVGTQFRF